MNTTSYNEQATKYAELKAQADALKAQMDAIAAELRATFAETGEQPVVDGDFEVILTSREGYTRQTWNGKGLTGYAVAHPEILAFLSEKRIPPTIAITVK